MLISVLNYCDYYSTIKCVNSIIDSKLNNSEIFIVDNNSPDNSYQKIKDYFKDLKVIKSKFNEGYAAGHKIAVNYAIENKFDFIWVLNNDLTVRKETLSNLLLAYNSFGLGIYGSITLKSENPDIVNFGGGKTDDINKEFQYNAYENFLLEDYYKTTRLRKVQSVEGSSMLIPLEVIKIHGFMKEDFFMYGEETDYCYMLKKLGIPSYVVPESIVIHTGTESFKNNKFLVYYYRRRNMLRFEKEHYGVSILKNIHRRVGIFNFLIFFLKNMLFNTKKNSTYYLNLANFHALINNYGQLKNKLF